MPLLVFLSQVPFSYLQTFSLLCPSHLTPGSFESHLFLSYFLPSPPLLLPLSIITSVPLSLSLDSCAPFPFHLNSFKVHPVPSHPCVFFSPFPPLTPNQGSDTHLPFCSPPAHLCLLSQPCVPGSPVCLPSRSIHPLGEDPQSTPTLSSATQNDHNTTLFQLHKMSLAQP